MDSPDEVACLSSFPPHTFSLPDLSAHLLLPYCSGQSEKKHSPDTGTPGASIHPGLVCSCSLVAPLLQNLLSADQVVAAGEQYSIAATIAILARVLAEERVAAALRIATVEIGAQW